MPPPKSGDPKRSAISPGLPQFRSEAIAELTAKARQLRDEATANQRQINELTNRNAIIQRSLAEIQKSVLEHAWDGQPIL